MDFDLAIVGAGTTGCAIARHLSRFDLKIALVDAAEDVAAGASRANSAIVHAGFDAKPGSLMARLNVRGNAVFEDWCRELSIPFNRCGSLVSAFTPDDEATLRDLLARGEANGVPDLRIVSGDEARALEPRLSKEALSALWAPSAAIACPYEFCIACAENARANGAAWKLGAPVTALRDLGDAVEVAAGAETFRARFVVDAAGVFADDVARLLGDDSFSIRARKGEYLLLDRAAAPLARVLFPCPTKLGKGILVSPTVDGNSFAGPTAVDQESKTDTSVTAEGIATLKKAGLKSVPDLDFRKAITLFAGLRAQPSEGDFVIRRSAACPRLVLAAGICSPGFTSAPAIAETVEGLLAEAGLALRERADWNPRRERPVPFRRMDEAQRAAAIAANPLHGRIVCRCETVTEAEIVDAIRRGATTLDAVKRRTRAGMGRCQGGFCSPRVMEILSRELSRPWTALTKDGGASRLVVGATRGAPAGKYAGAQDDIASEASHVVRGAAAPVIASEASPVIRHSAADDGDGGGEAADVAIVGGGPAGLAAAVAAKQARPEARVVVLERDAAAGGILRQCIHNGFGLHHFGEELTGPEYAGRFVKQAAEAGAEVWTDTMVLSVTKDREVVCMNPARGLVRLRAGAVVLAMGCRERTRGALSIPGTRPAGVFTAGCAQRLVNMEGFLPGRRVVILGSGDIGLIMARRMTWEGAEVKLVAELMPYSSGLNRNIVQCLVDNGIPLKFNHTVTRILGKERVEGVVVAEVDPATRAPIPGTEETIACDTLLLSVGLLPENELTTAAGVALDPVTGGAAVDQDRQTSVPGVFACGNVLHVHDLVDNVTAESLLAGAAAARFALPTGDTRHSSPVTRHSSRAVRGTGAVRYVVPQRVAADAEGKIDLYFRVGSVQKPAVCEVRCGGVAIATRRKPVMTPGEMEKITVDAAKIAGDLEVFAGSSDGAGRGAPPPAPAAAGKPGETTMTCICCPMGCRLTIAPKEGGGWTVAGNSCPRGAKYAVQEMEAPERVVTSTVRVEGGAAPLVAAKTASPVPKGSILACLEAIRTLAVPAPISIGQVLAPDLAGTGVSLVATSEVP